jgi:hypothetical protein
MNPITTTQNYAKIQRAIDCHSLVCQGYTRRGVLMAYEYATIMMLSYNWDPEESTQTAKNLARNEELMSRVTEDNYELAEIASMAVNGLLNIKV